MQWFGERYISREEHQEIVAYYRKLVASLQCKIRDLREKPIAPATAVECLPKPEPVETSPVLNSANVVRVDFRRPQ